MASEARLHRASFCRVLLHLVTEHRSAREQAAAAEGAVTAQVGAAARRADVLEWDEVQVLATNDVGFSWVKVGKKKGWLRSEYLQQDE